MRKKQAWLTAAALMAMVGSITVGGRAAPGMSRPIAKPPAQKSTVISYTTDQTPSGTHGGPLIQVTLNDNTQATFLLDTGTSDCCVTDTMAARLHLKPAITGQAAAPLLMDGGQARSVPLTMQIGHLRVARFPTLIIKSSRFSQVLGHPLDGILGVNLFRRFALIIEPQTHTLALTTPGKLTPAQRQAWGFRNAGALPLTRAANGLYGASIGLGNGTQTAQENLTIDTGAGTSVLSHAVARSLSLTPLRRNLTIPFGSGVFVGDVTSVPAVTLGKITGAASPSVAPLVWQDALFLYASRPESRTGSPHVLGMNILSGYSILLDFPGAMLYLQQPSALPTSATAGTAPDPTVSTTAAAAPG